jgi:aquaporin NIP
MSAAHNQHAQIIRRSVAEAIGTFFLVLIGPGAAVVNAHTNGAVTHPGIALAFAFVVCAMVYTLGHVSGAHINPAVTIAFWSARRFPARDVLPYILSQCAGAALARSGRRRRCRR